MAAAAQQRADAVLAKHDGRGARELFGEKSRVVRHQQRGLFLLAENVPGDGFDRQAHARERKVFGDNAAPSGGAEGDGRCGHWFYAPRIVSWRGPWLQRSYGRCHKR